MKNNLENLFKRTGNAIKNWWVLLVTGILSVALGIVVFFFPGESYLTLSVLFGVMMLICGVAEIVVAVSNHSFFANRGWNIAAGALNLMLGVVLCCNPHISSVVLPFLLGFWLMSVGFTFIGLGGDLVGFHIPGAGWTLTGGILLMLLSFCIFFFPLKVGAATIVILLGIALIVSGMTFCNMAFKLRNVHKTFKDYYTDYTEIKN